MLEENPAMYGYDFNPRRRKHRRNPTTALALPKMGNLLQGQGVADIVGAGIGLAGTAYIPGTLFKTQTGFTKVLISAATAIGLAYVAKMVSPGAGKAVLLGGMAGVVVQALNAVRPGTVPGIASAGRLSLGSGIRDATMVSPAWSRDSETVNVIQP